MNGSHSARAKLIRGSERTGAYPKQGQPYGSQQSFLVITAGLFSCVFSDDEEATQRALDEALEGESWSRVSGLVRPSRAYASLSVNSQGLRFAVLMQVDLQGGASEEREGKPAPRQDPTRMREILIQLKSTPLPTAVPAGATEE